MSYSQPNPIPYRSTAGTDAVRTGAIRKRFPLPPESGRVQFAAYALEQEFEMLLSAFPPAPKNTISTASSVGNLGDTKAILTAYSQPNDSGGGLGKFTGTFSLVPATWQDFKLMGFTFPGFPGLIGGQYTRDIFTDNVLVRLGYDYYVLDPDNVLGGGPTSGGGPANAASVTDSGGTAVKTVYGLADIPLVKKTNFVTVYSGAAQTSVRVNSLIKNGGENIAGTIWLETLPNREYYQKWIANAIASGSHGGWLSDVWDGATGLGYTSGTASNVGQFVIEDSHLEPYAGNIIARVTTYCLAK